MKDHEKQMLVGGGAGNKDICSTLRQDGHGLPGEEITLMKNRVVAIAKKQ